DDDAAHGFAVAIQFRDAAPHVGAELHIRHLAEQHRHAVRAQAHGDFLEIVEALHIPAHAQDELLLRHFERTAAALAVAALDRHADVRDGEVVGAEFRRIDGDLVLLDEATDGGDLRYSF